MWSSVPPDGDPDFDAAVAGHDARLATLGLDIWVGAEPTFTDRFSEAPEWNRKAVGGDKAARAEALVVALQGRLPGSLILRSVGRQYPGEDLPRWSLGLYRRRDGVPIWTGPPDPLLTGPPQAPTPDLEALACSLLAAFRSWGWPAVAVPDRPGAIALRMDPAAQAPDPAAPRLADPSVHERAIPEAGLHDALADEGIFLFRLSRIDEKGVPVPRLELPALPGTAAFQSLLVVLRAWATGLPCLVLAGYPPPVDASVEWTTVTPDPAVIEINTAPDASALDFLRRLRETHAAAAVQGLAPYRLYYNGAVADSGGGGQITLGGRSPETSPFLVHPRLLPRLLTYFNRHPALSYLYSHDYAGSCGQSVRCDERGGEMFHELGLTLSLLARTAEPEPELLWRALAPFLADASGNSHRAEINIEKLWNPYLPGRGRAGLVEFRALRMQHHPERAAAIACLLRAVAAMLIGRGYDEDLVEWGRELHQRFALPFYLERDLNSVLTGLDEAGLGLGQPIRDELLRDEFRVWRRVALPGCVLELRRGLEFWPLIGDAGSQDRGTSRLVDASTGRVELVLRPVVEEGTDAVPAFSDWHVSAEGVVLPLRDEQDESGPAKVFGLRYRSFSPWLGLHPTLGARDSIGLNLWHRGAGQSWQVMLHEWRPEGGGYPGLPRDLGDAAARRAERIRVRPLVAPEQPRPAPDGALNPWCLDLRYL
jgi:uncharacterized protein (DUF2126 family)